MEATVQIETFGIMFKLDKGDSGRINRKETVKIMSEIGGVRAVIECGPNDMKMKLPLMEVNVSDDHKIAKTGATGFKCTIQGLHETGIRVQVFSEKNIVGLYGDHQKCIVFQGKYYQNVPWTYESLREVKATVYMMIPKLINPFLNEESVQRWEDPSLGEVLMKDEASMDFALISKKDGTRVMCHRNILYSSYEFFQKLIDNSLDPENNRNDANLDYSGKALKKLKEYVYTKRVTFVEGDDAEEMVDMARMMILPGLMKQCEWFLLKELKHEEKWEMLVLAQRFGLEQLKLKLFPLCFNDPEFIEKLKETKDFGLSLAFNKYQQKLLKSSALCFQL